MGDGDKLYGSVTSSQIAAILADQGVVVDRRKILLDEGLRSLGEHEVGVKLHPEVTARLMVSIIKHGHVEESPGAEEASAAAVEDAAEDTTE